MKPVAVNVIDSCGVVTLFLTQSTKLVFTSDDFKGNRREESTSLWYLADAAFYLYNIIFMDNMFTFIFCRVVIGMKPTLPPYSRKEKLERPSFRISCISPKKCDGSNRMNQDEPQ